MRGCLGFTPHGDLDAAGISPEERAEIDTENR